MTSLLIELKSRDRLITLFAIISMFAFKLSFDVFPFLDDYIQFKGYSMYPSPIQDTYINMGLFSTRPLAGLLDILFYSRFFDKLYIPYFLITLMHFASVFIMRSNLKRLGVFCGPVFIILCLFNPVLSEATYWLSASTRLIPPFFFAQLGVYIIGSTRYKGNFLDLVLFWIINLISLGFYEQITLFSLFWTIFFCIKKQKKAELYISIFNAVFFLIYYMIFKNTGVFASRSALGFGGFVNLFYKINAAVYNGIKCGFSSFYSHFPGIVAIVVSAICILCLKAKNTAFCPLKIYMSGIIFLISFLPFAVLKEYTISFRNLFLPCIAFALFVDSIIDLIKYRQVIFSAICIFAIFSWSNEMTDYKKAYEADQKIISAISNSLTDDQKGSENIKLCITGAKRCYNPVKVLYGEHILNITSSDWALTGALRAEFENVHFPYVTLSDNPDRDSFDVVINAENIDSIEIINKNIIAK